MVNLKDETSLKKNGLSFILVGCCGGKPQLEGPESVYIFGVEVILLMDKIPNNHLDGF